MTWEPINLRDEAKRASDTAKKTGWQRWTWEGNFLAKMTLVRGELDEAVDAALAVMDRSRPTRDDSAMLHAKYASELADVAIRLLTGMHDLWGESWDYPTCLQKPPMTFGPFCEPDVLFRPIRNSLRFAEERWRKDDAAAARGALEDAFDELFIAASVSCVDLGAAIKAKQDANATRPPLHGKKRDLG